MFKIDFKKEVQHAIDREIKAQGLYTKLLEQAKTRNVQTLFETLLVAEQKHEMILRKYLNSKSIEEAKTAFVYSIRDFNICDQVIDPEYDGLSIRQGIKVAVKQEREAIEIYRKLFDKAESKESPMEVRDLFYTWMKEEQGHEALLIEEYKKLFGLWDE
jgi:rubrerythrin